MNEKSIEKIGTCEKCKEIKFLKIELTVPGRIFGKPKLCEFCSLDRIYCRRCGALIAWFPGMTYKDLFRSEGSSLNYIFCISCETADEVIDSIRNLENNQG